MSTPNGEEKMDTTDFINLEPARKKELPPIQRHPAYNKDPYKSSFLMSFSLKKQNDEKLKNIM